MMIVIMLCEAVRVTVTRLSRRHDQKRRGTQKGVTQPLRSAELSCSCEGDRR